MKELWPVIKVMIVMLIFAALCQTGIDIKFTILMLVVLLGVSVSRCEALDKD